MRQSQCPRILSLLLSAAVLLLFPYDYHPRNTHFLQYAGRRRFDCHCRRRFYHRLRCHLYNLRHQ